jgi:AcrR family transcriptional regulator
MAVTSSSVQSASLARRERQKAETRQAILNAARELFVRDGVEATTMRAIAVRIGYTPTAIYHHFRDKDALLDELVTQDFSALGQAMHRIGRIEDPVERTRRLGFAYVDFALENPSHYRFMFMTQQRHEHQDCTYKRPDEDAYAFLVETVTEGIEAGRFRPELSDPHELAQMLWASVHGIVSLWLTHCDDPYIEWRPPRETVRSIIDAMIRGTVREPR